MTEYIGEWTTVDKSDWGPGPWQDEPDKVHWIDPATGLDCLMHRGPLGQWCGYVAVTPDHPLASYSYDSDIELSVHGGITYGPRPCMEVEDEAEGICHVPQPGRPDDVRWLGFDCGHMNDYVPRLQAEYTKMEREVPEVISERKNHYWTRAEAEAEVTRLAAQIKEVHP